MLVHESLVVRMRGISNRDIQNFLLGKVTHFQGVYSSNNIPRCIVGMKKFTLICNHSKLGEPGSHFVTIVGFPNYMLYIDTFGQPCRIKEISNFLNLFDRPIHYNSTQIQSDLSYFCGFYSIMYVLYFEKRFTNTHFGKIKFDSVNLINNDDVCLDAIKQLV